MNPEGGPPGQSPWLSGPLAMGLDGANDGLGKLVIGPGYVTGNCPRGPDAIFKGALGGGPPGGNLLGGPIGLILKCTAS